MASDTEYQIEMTADDLCDVTRDRRAYLYDVSYQEAMDRIRRDEGPDHEVRVLLLDRYPVRDRT